jgi:glucose/mannose-6-phosphate isomerase
VSEKRSGAKLDDRSALEAADPSGMLALAGSLGTQVRKGFETAASAPELPSAEGLRSIAVCGMGGSGVAGDVLRSLYAGRLQLPIAVVKGYELPEFCGRDTLVFAMSFSGNTEETLAVYREAVARGCRVVAVSAGGELAALAEADEVARVPLPSHVPVPRAAVGYLATAPLGVLHSMGLVPHGPEDVAEVATILDDLAAELGPDVPEGQNEAKDVAAWLHDRTPVIWGSEGVAEAPALRWKTQFNENAKVPAWSGVLPELDHNEIEGWSAEAGFSYALIVLRHGQEHPRVAARIDASLQAIAASGLDARKVWAHGSQPMEELFSLIMLGDFTSIYLALLSGVDPTPIPVLSSLKERLRG